MYWYGSDKTTSRLVLLLQRIDPIVIMIFLEMPAQYPVSTLLPNMQETTSVEASLLINGRSVSQSGSDTSSQLHRAVQTTI